MSLDLIFHFSDSNLISEVGNCTLLAGQKALFAQRAKSCTLEGQKDFLLSLVFLKSMERDIKPSHLGITNPEYVLNRLNLLKANTEMTQIHDLGNTFRKKHSLF